MPHDARALANEFIQRGSEQQRAFTHLQIQKLIYYCQGWMLGIYGEPIIQQDIIAWKHGPVIRSVFDALNRHGATPVKPIRSVKRPEFTPQENWIIDQALEIYGGYSGIQLSTMTHTPGSPWEQTTSEKGEGAVISNELLKSTFHKMYAKRLERINQTHESLEKAHMEYRGIR